MSAAAFCPSYPSAQKGGKTADRDEERRPTEQLEAIGAITDNAVAVLYISTDARR